MTERIKEIMNLISWVCGYGKKKNGDEAFQDIDLGEIQEVIDTTPEELTKDDLMEMSAFKPVPDKRKKT